MLRRRPGRQRLLREKSRQSGRLHSSDADDVDRPFPSSSSDEHHHRTRHEEEEHNTDDTDAETDADDADTDIGTSSPYSSSSSSSGRSSLVGSPGGSSSPSPSLRRGRYSPREEMTASNVRNVADDEVDEGSGIIGIIGAEKDSRVYPKGIMRTPAVKSTKTRDRVGGRVTFATLDDVVAEDSDEDGTAVPRRAQRQRHVVQFRVGRLLDKNKKKGIKKKPTLPSTSTSTSTSTGPRKSRPSASSGSVPQQQQQHEDPSRTSVEEEESESASVTSTLTTTEVLTTSTSTTLTRHHHHHHHVALNVLHKKRFKLPIPSATASACTATSSSPLRGAGGRVPFRRAQTCEKNAKFGSMYHQPEEEDDKESASQSAELRRQRLYRRAKSTSAAMGSEEEDVERSIGLLAIWRRQQSQSSITPDPIMPKERSKSALDGLSSFRRNRQRRDRAVTLAALARKDSKDSTVTTTSHLSTTTTTTSTSLSDLSSSEDEDEDDDDDDEGLLPPSTSIIGDSGDGDSDGLSVLWSSDSDDDKETEEKVKKSSTATATARAILAAAAAAAASGGDTSGSDADQSSPSISIGTSDDSEDDPPELKENLRMYGRRAALLVPGHPPPITITTSPLTSSASASSSRLLHLKTSRRVDVPDRRAMSAQSPTGTSNNLQSSHSHSPWEARRSAWARRAGGASDRCLVPPPAPAPSAASSSSSLVGVGIGTGRGRVTMRGRGRGRGRGGIVPKDRYAERKRMFQSMKKKDGGVAVAATSASFCCGHIRERTASYPANRPILTTLRTGKRGWGRVGSATVATPTSADADAAREEFGRQTRLHGRTFADLNSLRSFSPESTRPSLSPLRAPLRPKLFTRHRGSKRFRLASERERFQASSFSRHRSPLHFRSVASMTPSLTTSSSCSGSEGIIGLRAATNTTKTTTVATIAAPDATTATTNEPTTTTTTASTAPRGVSNHTQKIREFEKVLQRWSGRHPVVVTPSALAQSASSTAPDPIAPHTQVRDAAVPPSASSVVPKKKVTLPVAARAPPATAIRERPQMPEFPSQEEFAKKMAGLMSQYAKLVEKSKKKKSSGSRDSHQDLGACLAQRSRSISVPHTPNKVCDAATDSEISPERGRARERDDEDCSSRHRSVSSPPAGEERAVTLVFKSGERPQPRHAFSSEEDEDQEEEMKRRAKRTSPKSLQYLLWKHQYQAKAASSSFKPSSRKQTSLSNLDLVAANSRRKQLLGGAGACDGASTPCPGGLMASLNVDDGSNSTDVPEAPSPDQKSRRHSYDASVAKWKNELKLHNAVSKLQSEIAKSSVLYDSKMRVALNYANHLTRENTRLLREKSLQECEILKHKAELSVQRKRLREVQEEVTKLRRKNDRTSTKVAVLKNEVSHMKHDRDVAARMVSVVTKKNKSLRKTVRKLRSEKKKFKKKREKERRRSRRSNARSFRFPPSSSGSHYHHHQHHLPSPLVRSKSDVQVLARRASLPSPLRHDLSFGLRGTGSHTVGSPRKMSMVGRKADDDHQSSPLSVCTTTTTGSEIALFAMQHSMSCRLMSPEASTSSSKSSSSPSSVCRPSLSKLQARLGRMKQCLKSLREYQTSLGYQMKELFGRVAQAFGSLTESRDMQLANLQGRIIRELDLERFYVLLSPSRQDKTEGLCSVMLPGEWCYHLRLVSVSKYWKTLAVLGGVSTTSLVRQHQQHAQAGLKVLRQDSLSGTTVTEGSGRNDNQLVVRLRTGQEIRLRPSQVRTVRKWREAIEAASK